MRFQLSVAASRCCLVLAVLLPVSFLGAQANSAPASKSKPKMMARPLPGMGSSGHSGAGHSGTSTSDINEAESSARARVPLFRPAAGPSVSPRETQGAGSSNTAQPAMQDGDRARIVLIRRRGTFDVPKSDASAAPVLVNDATFKPAPTEPVPAALPPGKIRVIPKESIKIGTPPAHP